MVVTMTARMSTESRGTAELEQCLTSRRRKVRRWKMKRKSKMMMMMMMMTERMTVVHWEYPLFCIITALYVPILSGAVLIFTGLRISATLRRRRSVQMRLHQPVSQTANDVDCQQQQQHHHSSAGSRRTVKILTFTGVAYFAFWSPYVVVTLAKCFLPSLKPPSAVEFSIMWLANANSAVNVFIYSYTNMQFRRQCILLASRLCCCRLFCPIISEQPNPTRIQRCNVSVSLPAINLSTINVQTPTALDDTQLPVSNEQCAQFLTVDNMKQAVSIETLSSAEDDHSSHSVDV